MMIICDSSESGHSFKIWAGGTPQTPVRQKMKTMPRSLQMLNVARLNMRAQKLQPGEELSVSEKGAQRLLPRRSDDRVEEKGKVKLGMCKMRSAHQCASISGTPLQLRSARPHAVGACVVQWLDGWVRNWETLIRIPALPWKPDG